MLTAKRLREVVKYDQETGVFTRLKAGRKPNHHVGSITGSKMQTGYWVIWIDSVRYTAHRLAWLYVHGRWPDNEIDHINGNKLDNRISNLRGATHIENGRNAGVQKRTAERKRLKGAHWNKRERVWYSNIVVNHEQIRLGRFKCPAAAHFAYVVAADKLFGEFARKA